MDTVPLEERKAKVMKSLLPEGKIHNPVYKKNESSWPEDSLDREI